MKTIFTLLFSMAMFSTTFAQYGGQNGQWNKDKNNDVYASNDNRGFDHHDNGGYGPYNKGGYGSYVFTPRERDMEIAQINREFDCKIQSVKNKPFMAWYQKKRLINNLEAERDFEVSEVIRKFKSPRNKFGDFGYGRRDKKHW